MKIKTKEELEEICENLAIKLRSVKEQLKIILQSINADL